jgi:hypothetical protein
MSEYGFGYYDGEEQEVQQAPQQQEQPQQEQSPKWFRDYMKKSQAELKELRDKLAKKEVAEQFQAKGYDPAAAALYQGDPAKVDDWLTEHAALLAKRPGAVEEEVVAPPTGAPASTVSAEHQEQLQRMQSAGDGAGSPQGSEAELVAAMKAARTIEDFEAVAKANGWDYTTDGLFG